jgi:uncharacterized protein
VTAHSYTPAWWVPGAHLQTLWGKLFRHSAPAPTRRERWDTPDGDFLALDRLVRPTASTSHVRLVLLHGLEGSGSSHYAQGMYAEAARRGWAADLLLFRSCGGELNRARRFYHSGETSDLAFVVQRLADDHPDDLLVFVGFSLGGNVLLRWLGERGPGTGHAVAAAAVSTPFDLARGARRIERGFSWVYGRSFLDSLRRKARAKLALYPDLFDGAALARARTVWAFDDAVTAPVHGFASAIDYYTRASSIAVLDRIETPTLLLSAVDDPFLPPAVLDDVRSIVADNPAITVEFPARGGHVGFVGGRVPWRPRYYAEWRSCEFLAAQAALATATAAFP